MMSLKNVIGKNKLSVLYVKTNNDSVLSVARGYMQLEISSLTRKLAPPPLQ